MDTLALSAVSFLFSGNFTTEIYFLASLITKDRPLGCSPDMSLKLFLLSLSWLSTSALV